MMKVSVIIPVYNVENYLEECLRSIMNQTLKEIEMICVDDGSTDSSMQILRTLSEEDQRIRILEQKNSGGGAARNYGIQESAGKYLVFLDSDDYFEEYHLEKMYQKCEETQADICVCKAKCYHEDLKFDTPEPAALREEFLPEKEVFSWKDMPNYIFNSFHNWPWNKMFRSEFVKSHHLQFQEIKRTNDLYFTCTALMEAEKITVVKEELINYRVGMKTNCQSTNTETPLDFYYAFLALKKYLVERELFGEVEQSFVNHALDGCIANLNSMEDSPGQEKLYHHLMDEIWDTLSIQGKKREYYYPQNQRMFSAYEAMMEGGYPAFLRNRVSEVKLERDHFLIDLDQERKHAKNLWKSIEGLQKEKQDLLHCREYRIGAKILFLPLKVVHFLRGEKKCKESQES